jgi:hypothetical protein
MTQPGSDFLNRTPSTSNKLEEHKLDCIKIQSFWIAMGAMSRNKRQLADLEKDICKSDI